MSPKFICLINIAQMVAIKYIIEVAGVLIQDSRTKKLCQKSLGFVDNKEIV
jgi:hypothetical protein